MARKLVYTLVGVVLLVISSVPDFYGYEDEGVIRDLTILAQDKSVIAGNSLMFFYKRHGVDYFFNSSQATSVSTDHVLYQISKTTVGEDETVTIGTQGGDYLRIENLVLQTTPYFSRASKFRVSASPESNGTYTLYSVPGFLVTPFPSPPFAFYLGSRYPDEPNAQFYWREATVKEAYSGKRDNVNRTLSLIRRSGILDKSAAYSELLVRMGGQGHIYGGPEIFTVAAYIAEDLGTAHPVFLQLPSVVQLLINGGSFNLSATFDGAYFPMKYSWASRLNEDIHPYTFTMSASSGLWAISYSNNFQLRAGVGKLMVDIMKLEKEFIFQLHLSSDLKYIQLYCYLFTAKTKKNFHPIVMTYIMGRSELYFIGDSQLTIGHSFNITQTKQNTTVYI